MTDPLLSVAQSIMSPSIGQNLQYAQLRQGVVTAVNLTLNTADITMSGDTVPILAVKCIKAYVPTVADVIWLLKSGSDLIGLGVLGPPGMPVLGAGGSIHNFCTTTTLSTNTTWGTLAGSGVTFSFTKQWADTNLYVAMSATIFSSTVGAIAQIGPNVGGTTWTVGSFVFNQVNVRGTLVGTRVATGISAGVHTVSAQIRNYNTTGTLTMNTDDWFSVSCLEIGG